MKTKSILTILSLMGVFLVASVNDINAQVVVSSGYADDVGYLEHVELDDHYGETWISPGRRSGEKNSMLMLSKRYSGQSVEKEGTFNVDKSTKKLRFSIKGEVKSGAIVVTLKLPDGTTFKKLSIDDSADIMWSESIGIKEGEKKYFGDWKYVISTTKADGFYQFSINSA